MIQTSKDNVLDFLSTASDSCCDKDKNEDSFVAFLGKTPNSASASGGSAHQIKTKNGSNHQKVHEIVQTNDVLRFRLCFSFLFRIGS